MYTCKGKYFFVFSGIILIEQIILGLLSLIAAFKTKKHLPTERKYRKYHESAVINLTTMMALFLSTICEAILILFQLNNIHNGRLLIVTLRECLWLYPMSILLFVPKVMNAYARQKHMDICTHTTHMHALQIIVYISIIQNVYMSFIGVQSISWYSTASQTKITGTANLCNKPPLLRIHTVKEKL